MESASSKIAQWPLVPDIKCQLCDEYDIQWKCLVCDELICDSCKKSHLKSKASRNHRVMSTDGTEKQQYGGESNEVSKCESHLTEYVQAYCQQCQSLVCMDCITGGAHQNHKLSKIHDVSDMKQKELTQILDETKQKLSTFLEAKESLKKIQQDFSDSCAKTTLNLEARNIQLKNQLDQITDKNILQLQQVMKKELQKVKNTDEYVSDGLSALRKIVDDSQIEWNTLTIFEKIRLVTDIKQTLDKYKQFYLPDLQKAAVFVTGDIDENAIQDLFGKLNMNFTLENIQPPNLFQNSNPTQMQLTNETKVTSSITMKNKNLIVAVNAGQAWLGRCGHKDLSLVTLNGCVVKTVKTDFNINDFAVTTSNELVVLVSSTNTVKKLTSQDMFEDIYSDPEGNTTQGITATDNNHIIICLYVLFGDSKLVHLNSHGQLKNTIQYNTDGQTPLFDNAERVSSNINGDLIVTQPYKNIVVVDKNGHRRFIYTGQVKGLKKTFNPRCAVTDKYGHILISDFSNSVIHRLDKDGNFVQLILIDKLQNPDGLSVDISGRLWVCSVGNSKVMVVEYV